MGQQTYINQIGRNLLAAVAELPKTEEIKGSKKDIDKRVDKGTETDGGKIDSGSVKYLYELRSFYLSIYQRLSTIDPAIPGLPEDKEIYPIDRKRYDKCVDRVLRILLVLYAIGLVGEYRDESTGALIEVNPQDLLKFCKILKVTALDSVLDELNCFGIDIRKEDGKLNVRFANDTNGNLAKYHCIYAKHIGGTKPEDTKAISRYFRCDLDSLLGYKSKKVRVNEENFIAKAFLQEKAEMLCEIIHILKTEMDCRSEEKISFYKGILSGSISVAYKHRKTGRTIVSFDTKAGEVVLRLNFTTQTLGKIFLLSDEFPAEVFDNIKKCYCKGNECMGHKGIFIPEAGISFCNHIIRYEIRDLQKNNFTDFCRLLYAQFRFLNEDILI